MSKITLNAMLVDGENLSVELPNGLYQTADGTRFEVRGYGSHKTLIHKNVSEGIRPVCLTKILTKYIDAEGEFMTPEGFQMALEMLETTHRLNPNDLDAEFNYRKFKLKWNPVHELKETIGEEIVLQVTSEIQSSHPSKHVKSSFSNKVGYVADPYYTIDRTSLIVETISNICKEKNLEFYHDSGRDLQWVKIRHNGKEFTPLYNKGFGGGTTNVKSAEVDSTIDAIQRRVESLINEFIIREISPVPLDTKTSKDVLSFLTEIQSTLSQLDVKMKSYNAHSSLCSKIGAFKSSFVEMLTKRGE